MKGAITYAPATFEERGAAVAFTTPLLSQTRVRRDERERLEVLIPSFADGRGIYVVPWRAVPDVVAMTAHDRFLHGMIGRNGLSEPDDVRKATLKAARGGLAGPKGVDAARAALAADEEDRTVTNFLLILEVLRTAGLDPRELLRADFDSDDGRRLTRGYMARAADSLGIGSADLYRRVSELADAMSPVGLAAAPRPGRLRRRLMDLETFRDRARAWADSDPSDTAHVAAFCADVAGDTLAIGRGILTDFDRMATETGAAIRDWSHQVLTIRETARRLTWLTDGWDYMAAAWNDALERGPVEQRMTMNELFRILPLIPVAESRHRHARVAGDVLARHRRSVRAYEDWRTGRTDADLIARIEAVKRRTNAVAPARS